MIGRSSEAADLLLPVPQDEAKKIAEAAAKEPIKRDTIYIPCPKKSLENRLDRQC